MEREGRRLLVLFLLPGVILFFSSLKWISIFFLLAGGFTAWFFRSPERKVPSDEGCIVSPADGRILEIEELSEEGMKKVSVFMSILDVHVNRIPFSGRVKKITYKPGKFFPANKGISSQNERNIIEVETEDGWSYRVVQVAGIIARRIVCRVKEGDAVKKGDKFGLIAFGSRVEVYIPGGFSIAVRKGERVKGGETIIGRVK